MAETRRTILEAVAAQLAASGIDGFSIQAVADRAGVTHRTVYNYFPTREALNDAFADHVEAVIAERGGVQPDRDVQVAALPSIARTFHAAIGPHASHLEAYVMMTIATGAAAKVFRDRSRKFEKLIDGELGPFEPKVARLVTSAIRMFLSSAGWFLLRKHHGLSPAEAGRVSEWAVRVMLDAVRRGDVPSRGDGRGKNDG